MGLNRPRPRFGWALEGDGHDRRQTAYRLVVYAGRTTLWDSGKVLSAQTRQIEYAGPDLQSDRIHNWTVMVWDEADTPTGWAETQQFFTGLMQQEDWQADWIARYFVLPAGREAPADNPYDNRWQARPADHFRRDFATPEKPVRATAYVTALGLYELYVNGTRVGDAVMAPGWTDYHQRVEYQSHDVTDLVRSGTISAAPAITMAGGPPSCANCISNMPTGGSSGSSVTRIGAQCRVRSATAIS